MSANDDEPAEFAADGSNSLAGIFQYLENPEFESGLSFPLASGIRVGQLATGLVGGTIVAVVLGIQSMIQAAVGAAGVVFAAVTGFTTSVIGAVGTSLNEALARSFGFSVDAFGPFGLLVAIGATLAAFGILSLLVSNIDEVVG